MKLIFLGAPGAGKGTIAKLISQQLHIPHISTGDMFRREIKKKTPLGRKIEKLMNEGRFVSDEDTIAIVKKRLEEPDCKNGFILDGFPRTLYQADTLSKLMKLDAVINFHVEEGPLVHRLLGRRSCPKCKKEYNMTTVLRPKHDEMCDICNVPLIKRSDDNEKVIRDRLNLYKQETQPLIDYYGKKGVLKTTSGWGDPVPIAEEVLKILRKK